MRTLIFAILELSASFHLMMSIVLFYLSRRNVRFLPQAWIFLLIALMHGCGIGYILLYDMPHAIGILHPFMLIYMLVCSYLLSIHPLGLSLPGYLQWGRMVSYATPALGIIAIYLIGWTTGSDTIKVYEAEDIKMYLLSGDVLLRFAALLLSGYYILNIFLIPHRLVKKMELPRATKTYGTALGIVSTFFLALTFHFSAVGFIIYLLLLTLVNMALFLHILAPVVHALPMPAIVKVEQPPTPEEIFHAEKNNFNEANLRRFRMVEYIMQHDKPWLDPGFTRDRLCRLTGLNRHLLLQSLRSQGYNDTHEYIYRYRIEEFKRRVLSGELTNLHQCEQLGFRSRQTIQVNFERLEGESMMEWFNQHKAPDEKE